MCQLAHSIIPNKGKLNFFSCYILSSKISLTKYVSNTVKSWKSEATGCLLLHALRQPPFTCSKKKATDVPPFSTELH